MMGYDKIKAAARRRMAETGEPYTLARRAVIEEHKAAPGESVEPLPPSPQAEQPDAIREFSAAADGLLDATAASIARTIAQADKLNISIREFSGAERMATAAIATAFEQAARFHASVRKIGETERMATAGIARAWEQADRFHASVRKIGETERMAVENLQRAVEQVNRVQDTIERLGWI